MKSMRPTLYGSRHGVSAGHYLAAAAGFAILEAGGNAIDAGCAAGIALGRAPPRRGECSGRRADHDPHRTGKGRHHRRARSLAEELSSRPLHAQVRRQDATRDSAHRRARGAGCVDHGADRLRHYVVRRRGTGRDPLCEGGVRRLRVPCRSDQALRGRIPVVALERRDLSAGRPSAKGRRPVHPDRPRRHIAVHGR